MSKRLWIVPLLTLFICATAAQAQFKERDYELTLNGAGANGPDFDGVSFNVGGSLGYFLTNEIELLLRQTIGYSDVGGGGSNLNGSTRIAADWNFSLGTWVPYVGANIGYAYGDSVADSWLAAPEGGVKWFVNETTFVFFSVEYQFFFDEGEDADDAFSDGQFLYGLGIGFRF